MVNQKNFGAGVFYVAFGVAVSIGSLKLPIGTAADMQAGYFPLLIGVSLVFVGSLLAISSMKSSAVVIQMETMPIRPMVFVCLGVISFGLLIKPGGIVSAVPALFIFLVLAQGKFSWQRWVLMSAILVTAAWLIFVLGLKLRVNLLPDFLTAGA